MPRSERTQKRIKLSPAEKEAIYALPLHMQYEVVCVNVATRHRVLQHILVDPAARDYKQVRAVAIAYTEECDCLINATGRERTNLSRPEVTHPGWLLSTVLLSPRDTKVQ